MVHSPFQKARFVCDGGSSVLALVDALATGVGTAISDAFADVARARGIGMIASEAGLAQETIYAALANRDRPDTQVIAQIADAMIRSLSARSSDPDEGE